MSSNDKAKQKLMESMRMTKAGSSRKTVEADTKKNITPKDGKPVKQKKKVKKASTNTLKSAVDPYQTERRVWPD